MTVYRISPTKKIRRRSIPDTPPVSAAAMRVLLVFLLLTAALSADAADRIEKSSSQGKGPYWSQSIISGAGTGNMLDEYLSPLEKTGLHSFINHENFLDFGSVVHDTDFGVTFGADLVNAKLESPYYDLMPVIMNPYVFLQHDIRFLTAEGNFGGQLETGQQRASWRVYSGGGINAATLFMIRNVNNAAAIYHSDISFIASVQGVLDFYLTPFSWDPIPLSLSAAISSSLLTVYNSYPYAPTVQVKEQFSPEGYFGTLEWGTVNKAWKARAEAYLHMHLSNGHTASFGYFYFLYNLNKLGLMQQGGQSCAAIGYTIPFSKPDAGRSRL